MWIKKEQIKGKRSYIFSCKTLEDLYSWIISINFLRVNAYYNIQSYTVNWDIKIDWTIDVKENIELKEIEGLFWK